MGPVTIDYPSIIAAESARLLEIAKANPLDTPIPTCGDMVLSDLVCHVGDVQRWATHILTVGEPPTDDSRDAPMPVDRVIDHFEGATQPLLDAMAAADPDAEVWTFHERSTNGFWFRRQAHEVAVHRWDADSATSQTPAGFAPDQAADLIDEFVHVAMPRVVSRKALDLGAISGDLHLHCTDTEGEWTWEVVDGALVVVDEHRKSTAAVRGPASDLALYMYNRTDDGVEVFGDEALVATWRGLITF